MFTWGPSSGNALGVSPLDAYRTGLVTALSLRRLFSDWGTPCIEIRNSTTGIATTIGFNDDGSLNVGAITTALAGADGTLRTWINQRPAAPQFGLDRISPTSRQPAIATAGSFLGKIVFDGVDDGLNGGAGVHAGATSLTVYFRGRLRSTSGTQVLLEHSVDYSINNSVAALYDGGNMKLGVGGTSPAGTAVSNFTGDYPDNNVHVWRFDRSQVTSASMARLYINGALQTRDSNSDTGTLPSGGFSGHQWYMGGRIGTSLNASIDAHTLLIYENVIHSDGDITAISNIIASL